MSQRVELLALVQKEDREALVQYVKNTKQQSRDLADTIAECSQRQREDLWESLRHLCTEVLLDDRVEDDEEAEQRKKTGQYAFLDSLVVLATGTLQQEGVSLPHAFLDTATLLHGVLLTLPNEIDAVKLRLAQLFESWWKRNLPGCEDIIANTFVYFLKRSLTKGTVSDMKSVWRLHSVLNLVNFDAANATDLRDLLGRCCSASHFVKNDEGRRFLAFVFTLNVNLVDFLHSSVKNQILFVPKSWLALYGDIYFKAWQKSSGDICEKIENDCIQNLMNHAIHAIREGAQPMSSLLFRVMSQFHRQKKQRGVDAMLLRLYNPILWRSLTVPNADVRANAATLLLDAFPLQDPNANTEDNDHLIQKQFDLMQRLLVDPCPVVRAVTASGVCRVLSDYIEMIPAEMVQTFLCKLLKELAWDSTSPFVRLAVVKGMGTILDNPRCHLLLKPLLPGLSLCLHDKAEKVRVAMVDLLLKVKGIASIKYWTIAPVEHFLARLEEDGQPVVRRVVELIFPSFLPLDHDPQVQVERCLTLIESNPNAARVFFLNVPRHLTLSDTVKYMSLLCRYVLQCVRSMIAQQDDDSDDDDSSSNRSRARASKKRRDDVAQGEASHRGNENNSLEDEEDEDNDDVLTQEALQGLLEAILLMWTAVRTNLDKAQNAELKGSIMKRVGVTLPDVLKVTQDRRIMSVVLEIAGLLPAKAVPTISRGILSKLRHMAEGSTEEDYRELLVAMCQWDMVPQLMQLLTDWLDSSLTPTQATPSVSSQRSTAKQGKKCVQIAVPEAKTRPTLALDYLSTMLRTAACKNILLRNHRPLLAAFSELLSHAVDQVERELEQGKADNPERTTFLEAAFSLHLRLIVLLHNPDEEGGDSLVRMKQIMQWGARRLVPIMLQATTDGNGNDASAASQSDGGGGRKRVEFASACVMLMLNLSSTMLMVGIGDKEHVSQLFTFCRRLLYNDTPLAVVDQVLGCLYQALLFEDLEAAEEVSRCMSEVMVSLNACLQGQGRRPVDQKVLAEVKNKVCGVITCVTSHHGNSNSREREVAIATGLMRTMLSAVLAELRYGSEQDTLPSKVEDGQDVLPHVSTCVLTCYTRNTASRRLLMEAIENRVKSEAVADVHAAHAIVHLLLVIQVKAIYHKDVDLKPLVTCVGDMVQYLSQQTARDTSGIDEDVYKDTMATIQTKLKTIMDNSC